MTAPAIAASQEGVRYQYRFFWREALPMLYPGPPWVDRVVMEHRGVAAVDDVVVYYAPPGVADAGALVRVDYYQLKFHLAQAHWITYADLVDPAWTDTKESLLWRFAKSWLSLRKEEKSIRLSLVTNWPWYPDDPLAPLLRDTGMLADAFFTSSPNSNVGKVRTAWRGHLTLLSDTQFEEFVRQLRLCSGALSQQDAGRWLADRCSLAGLRPPNLAENHSPYDDLAGRLLAQGRRELTRDSLAALVKQEDLMATTSPPFRSTCAIRSFQRFAHVLETEAAVVVNLTDLFNGREPITGDVWREAVPARLHDALAKIDALPKPVQLAFDTHLSIAWFTGTLLDAKAGISVTLRQKGLDGVTLWDTSKSQPDPNQIWQRTDEELSNGPEVAVVISLTHDVVDEVRASIGALAPDVGLLVHFTLPSVGGGAIRGGGHAVALAEELTRNLRSIAQQRGTNRTHVFAACPVSFAFLLGQRSAAIGPLTMYEYDFGSTRTYRAAMAT